MLRSTIIFVAAVCAYGIALWAVWSLARYFASAGTDATVSIPAMFVALVLAFGAVTAAVLAASTKS